MNKPDRSESRKETVHVVQSLRAEPGTYALVIRLEHPTTMTVGKLGEHTFPAGWYGYVGSAHGAGGVLVRTDRHKRSSKPKHWHVDYLVEQARICEIWVTYAVVAREHHWSQTLAAMEGVIVPVPGFGARDCRHGCAAHLVYFEERPVAAKLQEELVSQYPDHEGIYVQDGRALK